MQSLAFVPLRLMQEMWQRGRSQLFEEFQSKAPPLPFE